MAHINAIRGKKRVKSLIDLFLSRQLGFLISKDIRTLLQSHSMKLILLSPGAQAPHVQSGKPNVPKGSDHFSKIVLT